MQQDNPNSKRGNNNVLLCLLTLIGYGCSFYIFHDPFFLFLLVSFGVNPMMGMVASVGGMGGDGGRIEVFTWIALG